MQTHYVTNEDLSVLLMRIEYTLQSQWNLNCIILQGFLVAILYCFATPEVRTMPNSQIHYLMLLIIPGNYLQVKEEMQTMYNVKCCRKPLHRRDSARESFHLNAPHPSMATRVRKIACGFFTHKWRTEYDQSRKYSIESRGTQLTNTMENGTMVNTTSKLLEAVPENPLRQDQSCQTWHGEETIALKQKQNHVVQMHCNGHPLQTQEDQCLTPIMEVDYSSNGWDFHILPGHCAVILHLQL